MTSKKRCLIIGNGLSATEFDKSKIKNFDELDIVGVNTYDGHIPVTGRPNDIIVVGRGRRSRHTKKDWRKKGARLVDVSRRDKQGPKKILGVKMPNVTEANGPMKGLVCFFYCVEQDYDEIHVTGMDFSFEIPRYDGVMMRSQKDPKNNDVHVNASLNWLKVLSTTDFGRRFVWHQKNLFI